MSLRLCVLLWETPGQAEALEVYEDAVLPLLNDHSGRLVSRHTVAGRQPDDPLEVQTIEFDDQSAMDAYLADPRRHAMDADRRRAVARTQILRLLPPTNQG